MASQVQDIYSMKLSPAILGLNQERDKQNYIAKNGKDAWEAIAGSADGKKVGLAGSQFDRQYFDYHSRTFKSFNEKGTVESAAELAAKEDAMRRQLTVSDKDREAIKTLIRNGWTQTDAEKAVLRNKSNPNANNGSNQVKHTGGIANSSGNYFLEKGELVVSKNFKNGGYALSDNLPSVGTNALSSSSNSSLKGLDDLSDIIKRFEATISNLKDIKIEGLDKLNDIKIEGLDKLVDLKIEGLDKLKDIKIEGIDNLKDIKIEGIDSLKDIKIEGIDQLKDLKIDGLDKLTNIQIEGLENLQNIKIDGLSELRDIKIIGIEDLKDVTVKRESSVGADTSDALASTLKDFDSRIMNVEENFDSKLEIINTKVAESVGGLPAMQMKQDSDMAELRRELIATTSEISTVDSTIKRFKQEVSSILESLDAKNNSILTHLYSIKRN